MKTNYNTEVNCKVCKRIFFKTAQTGNQCKTCRRLRLGLKREPYSGRPKVDKPIKPKPKKYQPTIAEVTERMIEVMKFIRKIENRNGMIYSLSDINELIDCWTEITPVKTNKYDSLPCGYQLFYMWNDLKDWKEKKVTFRT